MLTVERAGFTDHPSCACEPGPRRPALTLPRCLLSSSVVGHTVTAMDFEREQAALIGRISAGLAHDLNGPVGVILGFTELAAEIVAVDSSGNGLQAAETQKLASYLEMIELSALRARGLTREIWEFARATVGTTGELDLAEQLDCAARLAAPALRAKGRVGRRE